jgi:hypothetical protein
MKKITSNKNNYIVCAIIGGLGNQILQYLFAKSLAKKLKCRLILDISFSKLKIPFKQYNKVNANKFLLNQFLIKETKYITNVFKFNFFLLPYLRLFNFLYGKKLIRFFFKKKIENFYYDYTFSKRKLANKMNYDQYKKNSYFYGYWQQILYSDFLYKNIKKEITLKKKFVYNLDNKINKKTIAIHIRGNDFLFKKNIDYNIANEKYYLIAIQFFFKKYSNPRFHIFTDDKIYAKKILNKFENNKNFIYRSESKNQIYDFEQLRNYYNYIIPNSTFSFVASFLSYKKTKFITIPKNWFLLKNTKLPKHVCRL